MVRLLLTDMTLEENGRHKIIGLRFVVLRYGEFSWSIQQSWTNAEQIARDWEVGNTCFW